MGKQEDFVLRALEERDVRFVRLWFTDVLGFLKSVAVAPAELEGAFAEGIGFDGSAIEGFARVYESDMLAKPDPSTFQILPWRGEGPSTARMFCDIVMPDGSPSYADPRYVLKRTLATAADKGFTFYTHPEIEFYLFKDAPGRRRRAGAGRPQRLLRPHRPVAWARTSAARRSRCSRRWASRWSSATTRAARASRRSTCGTPTRCRTADNIMTFRTVIREVALSQGIWATFMPKPFTSHPGSGMHTHVVALRGRPATPSSRPARSTSCPRPAGSSSPASSRTPARSACVTNQWVNSYKRMIGRRRGPVVHLLGPQQPLAP